MEISLKLTDKRKEGKTKGLELALYSEINSSRGAQVGGVNGTGESKGAQIGIINIAEDSSYGAQIGILNVAEDSSYGAQVGLTGNFTRKLRGVQISGLLNICGEDTLGVQVGPINYRSGVPWYTAIIPIIAIRTNTPKRKKPEEIQTTESVKEAVLQEQA
jgi:hypothetical protein